MTKALQMTEASEFKRAVSNPISDWTTLKGGIGDKPLDKVQIANIKARIRKEKAERKEQRAWEKFLGKVPGPT